ncbi:MAG: hypothetical protein WHS86_09380 [Desulfosoma sp.]
MRRDEAVWGEGPAVEAGGRLWEAAFVACWCRKIREGVFRGPFGAVALGASGGVDSATCAALCTACGVPTLAVQMIDGRVRGEHYHPRFYEGLGAELITVDITAEAADREKPLRLPPYWTTQFGLQLLARLAPKPVLWALVLRVKGSPNSSWMRRHYERLLTAHRVRKAVLETIAARRGAAIVNCANRTERELGYFVEGGVDDARFGHWAPLADLDKGEVRRLARFLRLPRDIIEQSPSPGFGGVRDEHFLGPYELVDRVLRGLRLGWSDGAILRALKDYTRHGKRPLSKRFGPFLRKAYVAYLRGLRTLSAEKGGWQEGTAHGVR